MVLYFQNIILIIKKNSYIDMEEGQYGKTHMDVKKETDMSNQDKVKKIMEQIKLKKKTIKHHQQHDNRRININS